MIAHSCRERKIESSPQSLILHNRLHSVRARTATLLHLSLPLALNHFFSTLLHYWEENYLGWNDIPQQHKQPCYMKRLLQIFTHFRSLTGLWSCHWPASAEKGEKLGLDAGPCNFKVGNSFLAHRKALFSGAFFQYILTGGKCTQHIQSSLPSLSKVIMSRSSFNNIPKAHTWTDAWGTVLLVVHLKFSPFIRVLLSHSISIWVSLSPWSHSSFPFPLVLEAKWNIPQNKQLIAMFSRRGDSTKRLGSFSVCNPQDKK